MEAAGLHVQQEAAHELAGFERHGLVAGVSLRAVVLPAEGHAALIECDLTGAISPPPFGKSFTLDVLGEQGCLLGIVRG